MSSIVLMFWKKNNIIYIFSFNQIEKYVLIEGLKYRINSSDKKVILNPFVKNSMATKTKKSISLMK